MRSILPTNNFSNNSEFFAEFSLEEKNFDAHFTPVITVKTDLPLGGNAHDVLIKRSGDDGDTEWIAPADEASEGDMRPITSDAVYSALATVSRMWFGTRAEYNALPEINPEVCYCIEEGT